MMKLDATIGRMRARVPYCWNGRVLAISSALVDLTFGAFNSYRARRVEACCFWYGRQVSETIDQADVVVIPRQINRRFNFEVPSSSIMLMSTMTRPRGWKNLAQLHTHPEACVEHSPYDDLNANSQQALSIVLPVYGARKTRWLKSLGVHEFQNNYWHQLEFADVKRRLRFDNTGSSEVLDLR